MLSRQDGVVFAGKASFCSDPCVVLVCPACQTPLDKTQFHCKWFSGSHTEPDTRGLLGVLEGSSELPCLQVDCCRGAILSGAMLGLSSSHGEVGRSHLLVRGTKNNTKSAWRASISFQRNLAGLALHQVGSSSRMGHSAELFGTLSGFHFLFLSFSVISFS